MLCRLECLILLELLRCQHLKKRFDFNSQNIIKSQSGFSKTMAIMETKNLVRTHYSNTEDARIAYYDLTFDGRFLSIWLNKDYDTPENYRNMDNSDLYYDIN